MLRREQRHDAVRGVTSARADVSEFAETTTTMLRRPVPRPSLTVSVFLRSIIYDEKNTKHASLVGRDFHRTPSCKSTIELAVVIVRRSYRNLEYDDNHVRDE